MDKRGTHIGEKGAEVQYYNVIDVGRILFVRNDSLRNARTVNYKESARGVRFVMQMKEFRVGD